MCPQLSPIIRSSSIITDQAANKVEEIHYLPFGETWTDTNSVLTEHKYTGQELDAETGLYYYGARYYNPQLGRFVSADSIVPDPADPQAFNRYSYVLNNPLKYTDPNGEFGILESVIYHVIIAAVAYFVAQQDGEVSVGVGGSVDSGGGTSGGGWNPDTGDTYYGGGGSGGGGSGGNSGQRILELYSMGYYTGIGPGNSERNGFYEYGGGYDDYYYWGYRGSGRGGNNSSGGGVKGYLENRAIGNIQTGNNVAGFIDTLGIAAMDTLLPQSVAEVPLLFMGGGIKTLGMGAQSIWKFGGHKSATKWISQMSKRGWTDQQITEALQVGKSFPAKNMVNPANSATRYLHPQTGRSVVIDDATREVIHIGGDGFKY